MPSLNFQSRFVEAVENGLDQLAGVPLRHPGVRPKRQTIRKLRKVPSKVGDTLHFFWGLRTKYCRRLGKATCRLVVPFELTVRHPATGNANATWGDTRVSCGPRRFRIASLTDSTRRRLTGLAKADGFESAEEMVAWFEQTHGLPFAGQIVRW